MATNGGVAELMAEHAFAMALAAAKRLILEHENLQTWPVHYWPGACSLSPHVVSREAGVDLQLVELDRAERRTNRRWGQSLRCCPT